jgi:formylglycine-generating enzyme required for sulfatase activity
VLLSYSYEVVRLDATGRVTERRERQARYFSENLGGTVGLEMVEIPAGTFLMGLSDLPRKGTAQLPPNLLRTRPQHQVTVPAFYMGKYEVTQAQWRAVAGLPKVAEDLDPDPSFYKGNDRPVERVSWAEAVEFCARLSQKTGRTYRLPSEAEWEYACRAGTTTPFHFGETITTDFANFNGEEPYEVTPKGLFRNQTTPVGLPGGANAFGLYDMHGNVNELCLDVWHPNYLNAPTDGSAWESGGNQSFRVSRGGGWRQGAEACRSVSRFNSRIDGKAPGIGFRVVMAGARTQ